MKVLWLASWYPSPENLLLGNFTQREAEAVASFCDVAVIYAVEKAGLKQFELVPETRHPGFLEIRVWYPPGRFRWMKLLNYVRANLIAWRHLTIVGFKPSLLHLNTIWHACIPALIFQWRHKLPLIVREHWGGYRDEGRRLPFFQKTAAKWAVSSARKVIAVSPEAAAAMQGHGLKGSYNSLPNVVDVENLPEKLPRQFEKNFQFIHVSDFDDNLKNISGIIRSAKKLSEKRSGFTLLMVGGLDSLEPYVKMANDLGLIGIVKFTGVLPHEETLRQIASSDALLMFSNREGLSCVVLEAMAAGLPVVSSAIGGYEAWVTEESGLLVPIGDEEKLVEAMEEMMNGFKRYDSLKIRAAISEKCSYGVFGKKLKEIYEEALGLASSRIGS